MVWRKSSAMGPFLKRLAELFVLSRELLDPHSACNGEAQKPARRSRAAASAR
jgi:hypothetical protein